MDSGQVNFMLMDSMTEPNSKYKCNCIANLTSTPVTVQCTVWLKTMTQMVTIPVEAMERKYAILVTQILLKVV